jgi:hypothetical protein
MPFHFSFDRWRKRGGRGSSSSTESTEGAEIERAGEVRAAGGLGPLHGQRLQADEEVLHNTIEIKEGGSEPRERI